MARPIITDQIVKGVKESARSLPHHEIARKFNLSTTTIFRIVNGLYDTGKLVEKKEKVKPGYFDADKEVWG